MNTQSTEAPIRNKTSSYLPRIAFFSTSNISKAFAKVSPNLATISGIYRLLWVLEENMMFHSHKPNLVAVWQWETTFSV